MIATNSHWLHEGQDHLAEGQLASSSTQAQTSTTAVSTSTNTSVYPVPVPIGSSSSICCEREPLGEISFQMFPNSVSNNDIGSRSRIADFSPRAQRASTAKLHSLCAARLTAERCQSAGGNAEKGGDEDVKT